tara:strand:+ start:50 stop:223 length:174 start_codon:yes stop_codon:yes gene_type:complete
MHAEIPEVSEIREQLIKLERKYDLALDALRAVLESDYVEGPVEDIVVGALEELEEVL